jgi:hypothetical protein
VRVFEAIGGKAVLFALNWLLFVVSCFAGMGYHGLWVLCCG